MLTPRAAAYARAAIGAKIPRDYHPGMLYISGINPKQGLEFCYLSLFRPLFLSPENLGRGNAFQAFHRDNITAFFTAAPVDPEIIAALELTPAESRAMSNYIISVAAALGKGDCIELGKDTDESPQIALLTRQIGGSCYRITYFDTKGPKYHIVDENPAVLLAEAWNLGYREFLPEILDDLAMYFDENLIYAMQENTRTNKRGKL